MLRLLDALLRTTRPRSWHCAQSLRKVSSWRSSGSGSTYLTDGRLGDLDFGMRLDQQHGRLEGAEEAPEAEEPAGVEETSAWGRRCPYRSPIPHLEAPCIPSR